MIIIVEPQCKGFAHEQFNAAFLYGYSLAYPKEKIIFFGENEHIKSIKSILCANDKEVSNLFYSSIDLPEPKTLAKIKVIFEYWKLIKLILSYAYKYDCDKIVFLSIYTYNIIPLKILLRYKYKNRLNTHLVLHGTLEFIKRRTSFFLPWWFFSSFGNHIRKIMGITNNHAKDKTHNKFLYEKLFKISMEILHDEKIDYIILRDDALNKTKEFFPNLSNNLRSIDLPYLFNGYGGKSCVNHSNKVMLLTFLKENASIIENIDEIIYNKMKCSDPEIGNFEIRVICPEGTLKQNKSRRMNYIGVNGSLSRNEIDKLMRDTKYFLFFYPETSYELTTSGLFFDTIAHCKPSIFLSNFCMDYYFKSYEFGYKCKNIDEIISMIKKVSFSKDEKYSYFCSEIKRMQHDLSIENNFNKLKFNVKQTNGNY